MNEILDALRTTFATAFSTTFRLYFKGRIFVPAVDNLPTLCVYPVETRQSHSGTLRDKVEYDCAVEIQISLKQYFDNTAGDGTQLDTLDALVTLVEDRESDGDLETTTVMGIINANLTIGDRVLYTDNMRVRYDEYMSANKFPVARAVITFTAYDRPNR